MKLAAVYAADDRRAHDSVLVDLVFRQSADDPTAGADKRRAPAPAVLHPLPRPEAAGVAAASVLVRAEGHDQHQGSGRVELIGYPGS